MRRFCRTPGLQFEESDDPSYRKVIPPEPGALGPAHLALLAHFDGTTREHPKRLSAEFPDLIPFLVEFRDRFRVVIPAIIYAERGYSFLLNGEKYERFNEEIGAYHGEVLPLTPGEMVQAIRQAHAHRRRMPFRDHARDYLIAGQCQGRVDVLITYNVRHFEGLGLAPTRVVTPEAFLREFAPV